MAFQLIRNRITGFLSFFIIVSLTLLSSQTQAEVVGKITRLSGSADVTRGQAAPLGLNIQDSIEDKDIIRTKSKSLLQITFNDGSRVTLAQRTRLLVSEYITDKEPSGVLDVTRGKIRAFVSDTFSTRKESFRTRTRTAIAGVQGTDFEVHSRAKETDILVHEGIVSVRNINTDIPSHLLIRAGQSSTTLLNQVPTMNKKSTTSKSGVNSSLGSGSTQDLRSSGWQSSDLIGSKPLDTTRIPLPATPNLP